MTIGISTKGNQIKGTMVSNLLLTRRFKGTTPKGFGFINTDGFTDDIFAHFSQIEMDGFLTLKAGQSVIFYLEKTYIRFKK